MIDDAELLRRYAQEKSEPAFTELVRRKVNFVYACALRRVGGDAHLAKDVTQQVFVAMARKAGGLMKRDVLGGWLYTTARNIAAQAVRTEQRRQTRESEAQIMNELTSTPAHDAAWQCLNPVLDEGMDQLPDADRQAVLLRFFEGKSFSDIGAKLRLSENAARMRVERALDRMRGVLARRGVTSTTSALALALANQATIAAPTGLASSVTGAVLALSAAGGSAAGVFSFMSTLKIVAGTVVVLIVAGTIASAVRQSSRPSSPVSEPALQRPDDAELKSRGVAAAIPTPVQSAPPNQSGASTPAPSAVSIVSDRSGELSETQQARRAARQEERRAAKQEANEANRAARTREDSIRRLTPLFQQLALTPEQQEKLVVLVTNQHESGIDSAVANAHQGVDISENAEVYRAGKMQLQAEFETEVKGLLGESGYEAFLANDLVVRQSGVVEHLQKRLTPGGAQLNEAQVTQLLTLLRERETSRVNTDVLEHASEFLSAPQMDSLELESMQQMEGPLKPAVQKVITRTLGKAEPVKK